MLQSYSYYRYYVILHFSSYWCVTLCFLIILWVDKTCSKGQQGQESNLDHWYVQNNQIIHCFLCVCAINQFLKTEICDLWLWSRLQRPHTWLYWQVLPTRGRCHYRIRSGEGGLFSAVPEYQFISANISLEMHNNHLLFYSPVARNMTYISEKRGVGLLTVIKVIIHHMHLVGRGIKRLVKFKLH